MPGITTQPTPGHKAAHKAIAQPIILTVQAYGTLLTVCVVAELLGRLARFAEHGGTSREVIDEAITKNMSIGESAALADIAADNGKHPFANVRPI